jgi:hypothetical protein
MCISWLNIAMDATWAVESRCADTGFPAAVDNTLQQIMKVLLQAERVADLFCSTCDALLPAAEWRKTKRTLCATIDNCIDTFGDELTEALYWRRGAMVYMLFATRVTQKQTASLSGLRALGEFGVEQLQSMLLARYRLYTPPDASGAASVTTSARSGGKAKSEAQLEVERLVRRSLHCALVRLRISFACRLGVVSRLTRLYLH